MDSTVWSSRPREASTSSGGGPHSYPGAQQGGREESHQEAAHVHVEGPVGGKCLHFLWGQELYYGDGELIPPLGCPPHTVTNLGDTGIWTFSAALNLKRILVSVLERVWEILRSIPYFYHCELKNAAAISGFNP